MQEHLRTPLLAVLDRPHIGRAGRVVLVEGDVAVAFRELLGTSEYLRLRMRLAFLDQGHDAFFGLSPFEAFGLWIYTTPMHWHEVINRELWASDTKRHILIIAAVINIALSKLPPFEGTVYRGLKVANPVAFAASYFPGMPVTFKGFTSCARQREKAYGGNVLFVIRSHHGRSLRYVAACDDEDEVLFAAGAVYTVHAVEATPSKALIELEEL